MCPTSRKIFKVGFERPQRLARPGAEQDEIYKQLSLTAGALRVHVLRALYLVIAVGILWSVERLACWGTLSSSGKVWAALCYMMIGLGSLFAPIGYARYALIFEKARQYLPPDEWEGRFQFLQPARLLGRFRVMYAMVLIAVSLVTAGPWLWARVMG